MTLSMLPPSSNCCQICGFEHPPEQPHNPQAFYYQYWFGVTFGRLPNWDDAMTHCSEDVKQRWIAHLKKIGIDPKSKNITGGIKTDAELEKRLGTNE